MPMDYVIAVKRAKRGELPADWQQQVGAIPGVERLHPSPSPERMRVHATQSGLSALQQQFGENLHIEPLILHTKS